MNYETVFRGCKPDEPLNVTFLVLPGISLLTYASAIDPLRAANRISAKPAFNWRIVSPDGSSIHSSAGLALPVQGVFDDREHADIFGVVAGFRASEMRDRKILRGVYRVSSRSRLTLGIEAGAWVLARSGLLDGLSATTHWEDFEDFSSSFPQVDLKPDRIVSDGRYVTTSGASPTFDLMCEIIRARCGMATALAVGGVFNHSAGDGPGMVQAPSVFAAPERFDTRVIMAIRVMEGAIDRPLSVEAIARRIGLSVRRTEMMFRREIGQSPGQYYLAMRLGAARKLLLDTRQPITDIASRTGFSSVSSFSRAYRNAFSVAPRADRQRTSMVIR